MLSKEFKRMFKNPLNLFFFLILPLGWFLGTKAARLNIQFLSKSLAEMSNLNPIIAKTYEAQLNAQNGFMMFMEGSSEFYISCFIAVLVGIIASASFAYDKNSGFGNFSISRSGFKKYFFCKLSCTFLVPFVLVFLSMCCVLLFSLFSYSFQPPTEAFNFSMMEDNPATKLFFSHYWIACFLLILILSLQGGFYALLGMGVSAFTSNRFLISISPFAIYIFCTLFPQLFSIQAPIAKYIAWIFPSYAVGAFIGNDFWYTNLPVSATIFLHLMCLLIPAAVLIGILYIQNKKQYIK